MKVEVVVFATLRRYWPELKLGSTRIVEVELDDEERAMLDRSAGLIRSTMATLATRPSSQQS